MGTIIQDEWPPAKQKKRRSIVKNLTNDKSKTATEISMQRVMRYRKQTRKRTQLDDVKRKMNARPVIVVRGGKHLSRGMKYTRNSSPIEWDKFNMGLVNKSEDEKIEQFKKKIGNVDNKVVYGKFWMNGCTFCDNIKQTWGDVVNDFRGKRKYVNVDIISENATAGVEALRQKTKVTVSANGYPTLYKIINDRVDYYSGDRSYSSIVSWLTMTR